jgi:gliding motility-associated-like protein
MVFQRMDSKGCLYMYTYPGKDKYAMRLLTIVTFLSLLLPLNRAFAQVRNTADCQNAIPVCQNIYQQNVAAAGPGDIAELTPANQDCLGGENRTTWYVINVVKDGILVFQLTPINPPGQVTDYDFAMWDATGKACAPRGCDYVNNNLPVRCNYAAIGTSGPNGETGLSTTALNASEGAGGPSFSSALTVKAGETYILLIDNFSNNTNGYILDFSASTASIFDQETPKYASVGTHCGYGSSELRIKMSELILCDSLAADGSDFSLIGPSGTAVPIVSAISPSCQSGAKFTSDLILTLGTILTPGNYTLRPKKGSDGNSLYDLCNNQQSATEQFKFTISPNSDPLAITAAIGPTCVKKRLVFNRGVQVSTISLDGSDFTIKGPDTTVKIIKAEPVNTYKVPVDCDTILLTNAIDIYLNKSPYYPGNYLINNKIGTDGDPLYDTCDAGLGKDFVLPITDQGRVDVTATRQLMCEPGYVYLNARPLNRPGPSGYGFSWTPSLFVGDTTAANTLAYVTKTTIYQMQIMDTFLCYGRDTVKVIVSVRNPTISPFTDTVICVGEQFDIQLGGGVEYIWSPTTGVSCGDCDSVTLTPKVTTHYTIKISDEYKCSDDLHLDVTVNPLPLVDVGRDTAIYFGDKAQLHMYKPGGVLFSWTPTDDLSAPNVADVYARPEKATVYTLTVADINGCRNSDSLLITILDKYVQIPSAFSPNGDGKNDLFRVANLTTERVQEFRIFNRWGQEVYSNAGSKGGWDGYYKGEPAAMGVYNYVIRIGLPDGRTETYRGEVTLVR